jgi:hypothetical protein
METPPEWKIVEIPAEMNSSYHSGIYLQIHTPLAPEEQHWLWRPDLHDSMFIFWSHHTNYVGIIWAHSEN